MRLAFHREHEQTDGHRGDTDAAIDLVNLRLVASGLLDRPRVPSDAQLRRAASETWRSPSSGSRPAYFGPAGTLETPVVERASLSNGRTSGPLIVEEYDATTVVPPGCSAYLDDWGNINIDVAY